MNKTGKYASPQIVRALAAWAVVFHHYMQLYFDLKGETFVGKFFANYGAIGVDVFFVLSGFVIYMVAVKSNEEVGAVQFLIDRVFRIVPAYWFYSAVVMACIHLFPDGFSYTAFNLKTILATAAFIPVWNPSGLGMFPVLTVGWTLNFEMFFYVALACCITVSRRHFFKLLFCLFVVLPIIYPRGIFFSNIAASFALYEFLAGACLAACWMHPSGIALVKRYRNSAIALTLGAIVGSAALLVSSGTKLPIAVSIVVFALLCEVYLNHQAYLVRVLVKLGDVSYSTYLCHCIVIGIAVHATGKQLGVAGHVANLLAVTGAVYVISALSYRLIERSTHVDAMRKSLSLWVSRGINGRASQAHAGPHHPSA